MATLWATGGALASRLTRTISPTTLVLDSIAGAMGAIMAGVMSLIFDTTPLDAVSRGGMVCALIGALLAFALVHIMFWRPI